MKTQNYIQCFTLVFLLCLPRFHFSQTFSQKAKRLIGTFNVYHFNPIINSEKTSAEIIDLYIENLDEKGIIFIKSDLQKLKEKSGGLLSEIESLKDDYLKTSSALFLKALERTDSILKILSGKQLNYSENDTAYFFPYNTQAFYSPALAYQAKRLERFVKSRSYERVLKMEGYEKLDEKAFNAKAIEYSKTIISNLRSGVLEQIKNAGALAESTLLNAIALRYDPHSNYFTQEQNKEFNKELSSKVESFGFYVDADDEGNMIIVGIEPGGSAWLSNQVNEGDYFQSIKAGSMYLSVDDKTLEEIQSKLESIEEKNITLTVKKQNGQVKAVKLVKQKITSDENTVKGYVLKKAGNNLGYISLPSFYTDMSNTSLPGCANDVAKEILKLDKDSINGLIIDLRYNGGGSMLEAMNLAGIFIDEGPFFIYKEKNKKPILYKDLNRGSIFKKPVLVLINEASASASELFSNIVRDYNLGLIVGQTSYGKGTAQVILPLDTAIAGNPKLEALNKDFIKMTHARFYKLNGSTHQANGIVPDIVLPKYPTYALYKESQEKFYLRPDSVVKKVVFTANKPTDLAVLRAQSVSRINASGEFKKFAQSADSLTAFLNSSTKVLIKFNDYKKHKEHADKMFRAFENSNTTNASVFKCRNNTFDEKLNTYNEQVKDFNSKVMQNIEKDLFINESFYILNDLIQQQKK